MWRKSFEFLKDHLSTDTIEKYGPKVDDDQGTNVEQDPKATNPETASAEN